MTTAASAPRGPGGVVQPSHLGTPMSPLYDLPARAMEEPAPHAPAQPGNLIWHHAGPETTAKVLETRARRTEMQGAHPARFLAQSRWPIFRTYFWSGWFSNLSSRVTQGTALLVFSSSNGLILQQRAIKPHEFSVLLPLKLMANPLTVLRRPGPGFSHLLLQSKESTRFSLSLFRHRMLFKHIYLFWTDVFGWNLTDKRRGFI